ncbi:hypothetical protein ACSMXM_05710 [Pacificimonas sp. ICDLI1SI03]
MVTDEQVEVPAHDDIDGMKWAKAFCHRFPSVELDDALGWFCNAIMAGYDTARNKYEPAAEQVSGWCFDMDAAPKNKRVDLLVRVGSNLRRVTDCKWDRRYSRFSTINCYGDGSKRLSATMPPVAWMPLPPLPTEGQSS